MSTPWILPPRATGRVAPAGGHQQYNEARMCPQAGLMNLEAHTMDSVSSGPSGRSSGLVTSQVRAGLGTSHYTEVTEFFEWVLNIVRKPRDVVACGAFS